MLCWLVTLYRAKRNISWCPVNRWKMMWRVQSFQLCIINCTDKSWKDAPFKEISLPTGKKNSKSKIGIISFSHSSKQQKFIYFNLSNKLAETALSFNSIGTATMNTFRFNNTFGKHNGKQKRKTLINDDYFSSYHIKQVW